jgi:hypothetical protein
MRAVADNLTRRRVLATPLALYIMADDLGYADLSCSPHDNSLS